MFKQRLLTTLILAPLVLFAIYYAPNSVFTGLILIVLLACGLEWVALIPIVRLELKVVFVLSLLLITCLNSYYFNYWLCMGLFLWVLIVVAIRRFPASQRIWGRRWIITSVGLLLLPLFAQSMLSVYHHSQGKYLVMYLLFLVWATDIGAYLAGKQWGRHKLIPVVSPGKTIEGVLGGFLLAMLVAVGGYYCFQPSHAVSWFVIAMVTIGVSVVGDLLVSMLKRRCKIKDSGQLLPGHGGLLDRLDSLIAALPVFYSGLHFLVSGL